MNGRRDNPAQSVTATRTVLAGGYAWLIALVALRPGWPEAMLLLAALVAVPLGLGLVLTPTSTIGGPGPGGRRSGSRSRRR